MSVPTWKDPYFTHLCEALERLDGVRNVRVSTGLPQKRDDLVYEEIFKPSGWGRFLGVTGYDDKRAPLEPDLYVSFQRDRQRLGIRLEPTEELTFIETHENQDWAGQYQSRRQRWDLQAVAEKVAEIVGEQLPERGGGATATKLPDGCATKTVSDFPDCPPARPAGGGTRLVYPRLTTDGCATHPQHQEEPDD